MSKAQDTLSQYITFSEGLLYKERELNDRFTAVEVFSQEGVRFHLFYYVVDFVTDEIFYGSFAYPDGVMIQRILNGTEIAASGKRLQKKSV